MPNILRNGFVFLLFTLSLYPAAILLLTNPWLQRHALYAHKLHSGFYHDVNKPESFGFAKHQVTPFNLTTSDGEILYAWHILPLDIVSANRDALAASDPLDHSLPLQLLSEDPDARVVVNYHGNAGHVAQGWRTSTYHSLSTQPHTHILTLDYRGFGHSTGSPTESGLILDGITLAKYALTLAPPHRITLLGQSLGTAVATSVALYFADAESELLPSTLTSLAPSTSGTQTFAGVILVAPFTSLTNLLLSYRIGGVIPVLAPLRNFPYLVDAVSQHIQDKWPTALRLTAYVSKISGKDANAGRVVKQGRGTVQIIHAKDDGDISWRQTEVLFAVASAGETEVNGKQISDGETELALGRHVRGPVSAEILEYGGHNRVVAYVPVALAVLRAFKEGGVVCK